MHHVIVTKGNLAYHIICWQLSHVTDEFLMNLAGNSNWHRNVLQLQLKKWPQGWEIQVSSHLTCITIQIFSPDRSLLTFKTLQLPLFLRWVVFLSFYIWETFTGASSDDPSTWFWQGELVKIDKRLKCTYTRVSHLSLTVTRTKCLQLQWQKTSKVKYSSRF